MTTTTDTTNESVPETHDRRQIPPWVTLLRLDLVEDIECVLQRDPSHTAEARLRRELPQLPLWQSHRAKPLALARERGGHAIEHAHTIAQACQRDGIALQVLGAINVQAHIPSIRAQRLTNSSQQPTRVDGIMDHIERGNHIILFRQPSGGVAMLETHPVGYACVLGMRGGLFDGWFEQVIPHIA